MRPILSPFVLFLLVTLGATSPAVDAQDDASEFLYLTATGGSTGHGNFSTFPPDEAQPVDQRAAVSEPAENRIEWWWGVDWLPENATVPAGTPVEVVVYVGALRNAGPTIDPLTTTETIGGYRITAALSSGQDVPFGSGSTILDMPVVSDASEIHEVKVNFDTATEAILATRAEDPADEPVFRLVVGIDASAPNGLTPNLFVDGNETPSRLRLAAFPVEAYRAAELTERAEAECNERILRQQPCEDGAPAQAENEHRAPLLGGLPGIGFIIGIAGLSAAAVYGARRIVP